jgi:hypothetical protein
MKAETFLFLNSFNNVAMTMAHTATVQGIQRMHCFNNVCKLSRGERPTGKSATEAPQGSRVLLHQHREDLMQHELFFPARTPPLLRAPRPSCGAEEAASMTVAGRWHPPKYSLDATPRSASTNTMQEIYILLSLSRIVAHPRI